MILTPQNEYRFMGTSLPAYLRERRVLRLPLRPALRVEERRVERREDLRAIVLLGDRDIFLREPPVEAILGGGAVVNGLVLGLSSSL